MANSVLAQLRLDLAERFELIDPEDEEFCWVTEWPMFGFNETEQRWDPLHHPFTAPDGDFDPADPGAAKALAYDVVWNGQELGGGSIRISDSELQQRVLEAIGISPEEANERFGFLLEALRYGAPPHGGIAYGLDRMVQRLEHADSIRDVIAFPKAASGADPLTVRRRRSTRSSCAISGSRCAPSDLDEIRRRRGAEAVQAGGLHSALKPKGFAAD